MVMAEERQLTMVGREVDWIRGKATDAQIQAILDQRDHLQKRVHELYDLATLLMHALISCDGLDEDLEEQVDRAGILRFVQEEAVSSV
jgi:hypothetical protein